MVKNNTRKIKFTRHKGGFLDFFNTPSGQSYWSQLKSKASSFKLPLFGQTSAPAPAPVSTYKPPVPAPASTYQTSAPAPAPVSNYQPPVPAPASTYQQHAANTPPLVAVEPSVPVGQGGKKTRKTKKRKTKRKTKRNKTKKR